MGDYSHKNDKAKHGRRSRSERRKKSSLELKFDKSLKRFKNIIYLPFRNDNRLIYKAREKILEKIIKKLADNPEMDVRKDLEKINQLEQILDMQKKSALADFFKGIGWIIALLVIMAFIPSSAVLLSTPGFIDVRSKAITVTLAEDFEWTGSVLMAMNKPFVLSHFSELSSSSPPELDMKLDSKLLKMTSNGEAHLESLFIPKGAKIWLEWGGDNQYLSIVAAPNSPLLGDDLFVRAEFKLEGDIEFVVSGSKVINRESLPCPMDENCSLPRSVTVISDLQNVPRIQISVISPLVFDGIDIESFSFSKYILNSSANQRVRCSVVSGRFQLRGDSERRELRSGECINLKSSSGTLRIESSVLKLKNSELISQKQEFELWYRGDVNSMKVGTAGFNQELTPAVLNWIMSVPGVGIIWSILGVLLGTGLVVVRVMK